MLLLSESSYRIFLANNDRQRRFASFNIEHQHVVTGIVELIAELNHLGYALTVNTNDHVVGLQANAGSNPTT